MIKNYNEQILSAPTKKGFNLTAWVTPFIVIALGGLVMGLVILAWTRTTASKELVAEAKGNKEIDDVGRVPRTRREEKNKKIDEKYKEKLDEELKDFDW